MLRNVNDLDGSSVAASGGPIGEARDCYFDDQTWTIRFFIDPALLLFRPPPV